MSLEGEDVNHRPAIGANDLDKQVNGVFHIDDQYTNGYHMYIPYGIHNDLFDTIALSSHLLSKDLTELYTLRKKYQQKAKEKPEMADMYTGILAINHERIEKLSQKLRILKAFEDTGKQI